MVRKINIIILHFFILIRYAIPNKNETISFKCGVDSEKTSYDFLYISQINNSIYHIDERRLDSEGFKKFNIHIDTYNLEEEMKQYNLTHYHNIFIEAMAKAKETLESLLKVKNPNCYTLSDNQIISIGINYWDKTKIGNEAREKNITTCTNDIDLIVFSRFGKENELGALTLATAKPIYLDSTTRRPIAGVITINRFFDYFKINSKEFLQSLIIHEITHILGFLRSFFKEAYHNIYTAIDQYNITRTYINSTRVVEVARKYFNCSDLEGVELEDYGGSSTAGSHWEARILLGDYMNGILYPEEQVISEFTLALLEDSGYYKANYYTGGLMRYGKNKGCKFVRDKCINNYEVNPFFENEFYDYFSSGSVITQSCSSGRQSRTYFAIFYINPIPEYYRYYSDSSWGGFESADYCPVPRELQIESNKRFYVGHCSTKGNGEYGSRIRYFENNENKYYKSEELEEITGETYSDHSFCFLSSLTKKSEPKYEIYSKTVRAVCYETFCSPKSLTVKIHDNYIVCPRSGGKIKIDEYEGFFLCPDYNLICSGTILCNDMFDCVEKQSEIKEDAFNYDYNISTTQNIEKAIDDDVDEKYNYELSDEGICIKYCKQCKENKKCIECRDEYGLVGNKENDELICIPEREIFKGYYKNNESIYYKCIDLCEKCSNDTYCEKCIDNFIFNDNTCIREISNCEKYYLNGSCEKCKENFFFEGERRDICINIQDFYLNNKSYYICNNSENNSIQNCKICYNNNSCILCDNGYTFIEGNKTKCFKIEELENKYFSDPDHSNNYINCSNLVNNCYTCNSSQCLTCQDGFIFLNDNFSKCISLLSIDLNEYITENNIMYYSCKDAQYKNMSKCRNDSFSTSPIIKSTIYATFPTYSSIVTQEKIADNNNPINEYDYSLKIYTIFFLQIQLRKNIIYIYIICDFSVSENFILMIKINIYRKNDLRFLEQYEKEEIELPVFSTNKTNNNIFEFSANLENFINTTQKFYVELKNINVDSQSEKNIHYDIILEGNYDNKNTEKVEELIKIGGTNFSKVVNKEINYTISQYKIKGTSDGCNLKLKANTKINSNRIIILTAMQYNKKTNTLNVECTLSSNNNYEIPCSLDTEGSNKYILKEFIYYNQKEIITIISNNKSSIYPIFCNNTEEINSVTFSKKNRKLTKFHIIIIVCPIALVIIIAIVFLICKITRKEIKRDLPEIVASTRELKKSNSN